MSVSVQGTPVTNSGSGTAITATLPTGIVSGEMLWVIISLGPGTAGGAGTTSGPAGWTKDQEISDGFGGNTIAAWWREADGTEGASAAFTASANNTWTTTAFRLSGQLKPTANAINAHGTGSATSTTGNAIAPSITTTADGCFIFSGVGTRAQTGAITPPASYTDFVSGGVETGSTNTDSAEDSAWIQQTTHGATGVQNYPVNNTGREYVAFTIAIQHGVPTITGQPATDTVPIGAQAIFSVAATASSGALHYQWTLNGVNVGIDSATYSVIASSDLDGAAVACTVTDSNGSAVSATASIVVSRRPQHFPIQQRM
jgi:hypothetical protein